MKISNINNNKGFTLIELLVVIAGLAALSSISVPNILKTIKQNKLEQAKATMNVYAMECLEELREKGTEFMDDPKIESLDTMKLQNLGYQIDGDKNNCEELTIKPLKENEKDLFTFSFRMDSDGKLGKFATPNELDNTGNFFKSCQDWAGNNCVAGDDAMAAWAEEAAKKKARDECKTNFSKWLSDVGEGTYTKGWNSTEETCDSVVCAFDGEPMSCQRAQEKRDQQTSKECNDWKTESRNNNIISPAEGETDPNGSCQGEKYWFHSGKEFYNAEDWKIYDTQVKTAENEAKSLECLTNLEAEIANGRGDFTPGPHSTPSPCGVKIWLCKGVILSSQADYDASTCGQEDVKPKPVPDRCAGFTPDRRCGGSLKRSHPKCRCI